MHGETERKPKHYNEGRHEGDGLVCILKAMKITLRQNVTSINMRLGAVKRSGAKDLQYVVDYDIGIGIQALRCSFVPLFCCVFVAISYITLPRLTMYL
jgi:hypothetical protein